MVELKTNKQRSKFHVSCKKRQQNEFSPLVSDVIIPQKIQFSPRREGRSSATPGAVSERILIETPENPSAEVTAHLSIRLVQEFWSSCKKHMGPTITSRIDREIEKYKAQHGGSNPLYFIMSSEEADELSKALRQEKGQGDDVFNTTYQDIKIIRNNLMERGEYFLGNELPETGS